MLVSPQGHRLFHFDPVNGVPYGRPGSLRQRIMAGNALVGGQFGALTTPYAGTSGKWYVDSTGTYQLAAQATPYLHHEYDSALSRWTARGLRWETGRTAKTASSWDLSAAATWVPANLGTLTTSTLAGLTAYKLVEDGATGEHGVTQTFAQTGTAGAFVGVFAAAERGFVYIRFVATATKTASVNLSTGAVVASSGITVTTAKRADGMWEVRGAVTGLTAGAGATVSILNSTDGTTISYAGTIGSGIHAGPFIYVDNGASEVGSLIPTAGTRTADVPSISSAWMNAGFKNAGRITARVTLNAASSGASRAICDCRDAGTNGFLFQVLNGRELSVTWNGTALSTAVLTWTPGTEYLCTLQWLGSVVTVSRDGGSAASNTLTALSTIGNTFYLGTNKASAVQLDGAVAEIYAEAL